MCVKINKNATFIYDFGALLKSITGSQAYIVYSCIHQMTVKNEI